MNNKLVKNNNGLMAWFILNPVTANLLMVVLLIMGVLGLVTSRVEGWPSIPENTINIHIPFQGGSPEELELAVAVKVETALNGLTGVKSVFTEVLSDSTDTTVTATQGYPMAVLKEQVKSRIDGINDLPDLAERPIIKQTIEANHVVSVEVYGAVDYPLLRQNALRLRDELLALNSVNKITVSGDRQPEISIEVKQPVLERFNLSLQEVAEAIEQQSINLSGGHIRTSSNRIRVFSEQQAYAAKQFADIVIRSDNNSLLKLGDVADIRDGSTQEYGFSRFQAKNSIQLNIELLGDASITETAETVKAKVAQLKQVSWLPDTISIATWNDESESIRDRLRMMGSNGLLGIILVFIILALFLDLHVAFWVAVGIPVSFAGTVALMSPEYLNLSINHLTTFGFIIVLGIVVDDAIIIGESIHSAKNADDAARANPVQATIDGVSQVAMPATFGVLTTVAAFFPLTRIAGEMGMLFSQIVIVVIACLLFSLVESKWILPAHLAYQKVDGAPRNAISRFFYSIRTRIDKGLQRIVHNYYKPLASVMVTHRYNAMCGFVALFLVSVSLIPSGVIKSEFFPDIEDDFIQATLVLHDGLTIDAVTQVSETAEQSLLELSTKMQDELNLDEPPVVHLYTQSDSLSGIYIAAQITAGSRRTFSKQELIQQWRPALQGIALIKSFRFDEDDDSDIYIALLGDDLRQLNTAAKQLEKTISGFTGVEDVRSSIEGGELAMKIELLPMAHMLGLTQKNVTQQIRQALYGYEAQRFQRGQDDIAVMVRLPHADRGVVYDLNKLRIQTPAGDKVTLSSVAELKSEKTLSRILRYQKQRVVLVFGSINDALAAEDLDTKLDQAVNDISRDYPGVMVRLEGDAEEEGKVIMSLLKGFVLGLLLIYVLLAIPLKSYLEPLLIMSAIPFGIIGAIAGHLLVGIPFTLLSFFGVLALSGVVVNDALILASRFNQIKAEVGDSLQAAVAAGITRFRAIILTSITTFAGLIPLLLERSEQAQIIIPMAVSLAFGVLFATVVTLLIIPILLCISDDFS